MAIRVLGPFEVEGLEIRRLGGPQQRAVLALLALRPNEAVRSERLIQEIWGDDAAPNAKKTLQVYVSGLRRALADRDETITTVGGAYRLDIEADEIDAVRFEALIGEAESTDSVEQQLSLLDEAIALWRGPPFTGLPDAEPLLIEARRLEELRLHAAEIQLAAELRSSDPNGVIGRLHAMVSEHPLRERLYALLMEALYRSGRQAEALRTFSRLRAVLAEELGIEPGPEVQELEIRILQQDSSLLDAPATHAAGSVIRGYELLEEIGSGAFGLVFRARQTAIDREVALKIVRPELASQPEFIRRFEVEAQIVASLDHPNIVPLYDFWRDASGAYMAMRISDGSLDDLERPRPLGEVLELVDQIASALAFAHANGVVHGDLKPENVLLEAGRAFLSDFGIAALTATSGTSDAPSLSSYTAPEVRQDSSPQSDVFGLAALTADLLGDGLDEAVASVIDRGTARDPEARHSSPLEFASELRAAAERETPRAFEQPIVNPYRGLVAFQESEADVFFGRSAMVEALIDQVRRSRFTAVVGPSGSGKSSVVRAGLIPVIRRDEPGWLVVDMVPGRYPFDELARALDRVAARPAPGLAARLLEAPGSIVSTVRSLLPAGGQLVLVVDQFEELFTLLTDDVERDLFLELVAAASLDPDSPIRLVTTLRADFYAHPLGHPTVGELFQDEIIPVAPMSPEDLEQAVVRPANAVGVDVDVGLVAQLVSDVVDRPGGLPLMQFALTELFENRDGQMLTLERYRQLGGLADALGTRAEAEYRRLTDNERSVAKGVFLRLVTIGEHDTRRRTSLDELEDAWDAVSVRRVLEGFDRARLLSFDHDPITRIPTVEVAHEALFTAWERLSTWVEDSRDAIRSQRRLAHASAEWEASGHDESFLLRGRQLAEVEDLAGDAALPLTSTESRFLHASVSKRDAIRIAEEEDLETERRINRRLRISFVGVVALAVLLAISGLLAFNASRQAGEERDAAELSAIVGRSLAAVESRPELALLLATEAYARDTGAESQSALRSALAGTSVVRVDRSGEWGFESPPSCSREVAPGTFASLPLPLADRPGLNELWIQTVEGGVQRFPSSGICVAAMSPDGTQILSLAPNDSIEIIDLATGETRGSDEFSRGAWGPDGRLLAKAGPLDGQAPWVWVDPLTLEVVEETGLEAHFAVFSADGSTLLADVVRGSPGLSDRIATYDGRSLELLSQAVAPRSIGRASIARDGSVFGYVHEDGVARVWDAQTADPIVEIPMDEVRGGFPGWVAFEPDGEAFAVVVGDGKISVFSGPGVQSPMAELSVDDPIASVSFLNDLELAVLSTSGTLRLFSLTQDSLGLRRSDSGVLQPAVSIPCCEGARPLAVRTDGDDPFVFIVRDFSEEWTYLSTGKVADVRRFNQGDSQPIADRLGLHLGAGMLNRDGSKVHEKLPIGERFEAPFGEVGTFLLVKWDRAVRWERFTDEEVIDVRGELMHGVPTRRAFAYVVEGTSEQPQRLELGVFDIETFELEGEVTDFIVPNSDLFGWTVQRGGWLSIVTGEPGAQVFHLYDFEGEKVGEPISTEDTVLSSSVSQDGRFLLIGLEQAGVTLRVDLTDSTITRLPLRPWFEPPVFLSDGRFLAVDPSGTLSLWDVETGREVLVLAELGQGGPSNVLVSSDESEVWYPRAGQYVSLPLVEDELASRACELAGRSLTPEEWEAFIPGDQDYDPFC